MASCSGFKLYMFFFPFVLLCCFACSSDDEIITCPRDPVFDGDLGGAFSDPATITYAGVLSNCLEIRFNYSGCSENSEFHFAVSQPNLDSYPPQQEARLALAKDGDCAISHSGIIRVNLVSLQVEGSERVKINLAGWGGDLQYGY